MSIYLRTLTRTAAPTTSRLAPPSSRLLTTSLPAYKSAAETAKETVETVNRKVSDPLVKGIEKSRKFFSFIFTLQRRTCYLLHSFLPFLSFLFIYDHHLLRSQMNPQTATNNQPSHTQKNYPNPPNKPPASTRAKPRDQRKR